MQKPVIFLFCLILSTSFLSFGQGNELKTKGSQLGLSFSSLGSNDVVRFREMTGEAGYNSHSFYTVGLIYLYRLKEKVNIETGIEYSNHTISIHPNVPPDMDRTPYLAGFSLISIPVSVRLLFLKYFFLSGGVFLDIDANTSSPIESQTGVGGNLGLGIQYNFKKGISAFVNPYLKAHSLLHFSMSESHQHVMENGFRFGLLYNLK